MPIIQSLLDQDYYTFTVQQVAFHQFDNTIVRYRFKCRNKTKWTRPMLAEIRRELAYFCVLRFSEDEIAYLRTLPEFSDDYVDWLVNFQPGIEYVCVWIDERGGLQVCIEGPWKDTVIFEVPLLAIINEVHFKQNFGETFYNSTLKQDGLDRTEEKVKFITPYVKDGFKYAELGTRRRYSFEHHLKVNEIIRDTSIGTSNVLLSRLNGTKPLGTMSHQYIMVGAGLGNVSLRDSQTYMLNAWIKEYKGKLDTALTDTYGIDAFLRDYNDFLSVAFPGLRHDSGCPYIWTNKVARRCSELSVDIATRKLVYSDGLNFKTSTELFNRYGYANQLFGIGTWFTNDFRLIDPLQIVMKIVRVNGSPVAKVSDSNGKGMCESPVYERHVRDIFQIK